MCERLWECACIPLFFDSMLYCIFSNIYIYMIYHTFWTSILNYVQWQMTILFIMHIFSYVLSFIRLYMNDVYSIYFVFCYICFSKYIKYYCTILKYIYIYIYILHDFLFPRIILYVIPSWCISLIHKIELCHFVLYMSYCFALF